uniref:Glycoside hydrolase family 38 N-terminal domain-containing protein n=1 Tax=Acrobeloides nanus TaxID=290746 RepID=A0A914CAJ6_9BILA
MVTMKEKTCSWNNCPKWDHKLMNIHMIPFSHDDMGWLKTTNQYYYYGPSRKKRQISIRDKFPSVIQSLKKDPKRKFSYSEVGFLKRWLYEDAKENFIEFKKLVDQERFQQKTLRFNWHVSLDNEGAILAEILPQISGAPFGLCWDVIRIDCGARFNDPVIDDPKLGIVNVDQKLTLLINEIERQPSYI